MSHPNDPQDLFRRLEQLLEVHGADRSRWPAAERLRLAPLIAGDSRAKAALMESAALDRLLDTAPVVSIERERALARRIVAAAQAAPRGVNAPGKVVPLRRPGRASALLQPVAALLAASLVLGIVVGSTGMLAPGFSIIADAIGLSDDESELALANDVLPSGEETL